MKTILSVMFLVKKREDSDRQYTSEDLPKKLTIFSPKVVPAYSVKHLKKERLLQYFKNKITKKERPGSVVILTF